MKRLLKGSNAVVQNAPHPMVKNRVEAIISPFVPTQNDNKVPFVTMPLRIDTPHCNSLRTHGPRVTTMSPTMTQSGPRLDIHPMSTMSTTTGTTDNFIDLTSDGGSSGNIPVLISSRPITHSLRRSNQDNLLQVSIVGGRNCILPVIFCANTRSVRNKLNDLSVSARSHQADVVCVVESWLDEDIDDSCLTIGENYSPPQRHDRCGRIGGGVAVWFHQNFQFKVWRDLIVDNFETMWFTVWSHRMPRDCSRVILGVVYFTGTLVHQHREMAHHIINAVDHIRRSHSGAKVILVGDFNQLPERLFKHHLQLKQTVFQPTRQNAILDKLFTDMHQSFYPDCLVSASIANSDHHVIVAYPTISYDKGELREVTTRVLGQNEKSMFAYDLSKVKWETLYGLLSCEEKAQWFTDTLQSLLQKHFPPKVVKRHSRDKPWVTDHYRSLIKQRQCAFMSGNMPKYRELRNKVNKLSQRLERDFYKRKVEHLKTSSSGSWWRHMKGLLGMNNSSTNPLETLALSVSNGDMGSFVSDINNFLKSVSAHISPLSPDHPCLTVNCDIPDCYLVSVSDMEKRLLSLKVNKSTGPDDIPAWVLRDFSHLLAGPLASILNDSLREGVLPSVWKTANTIPLPKVLPPKSISTDIRPISITPVAAKATEFFPVKMISDFLQDKLHPDQFGAMKDSSTALALIKIIDFIAACADKKSSVRMLLCDFSKAFDLVDHTIVIDKLASLGVHQSLVKWCANFLSQRTQRVKLGTHVSDLMEISAGCPQGTLLGPLAFIVHINDLQPPSSNLTVKYVDDTSVLHAVNDSSDSSFQNSAEYLHNWAKENNMIFNVKKTKELVFHFKASQCDFPVLTIGDDVIERVSEAKILGVTIQSDLKWNSHITNIIKKANKRLYLLSLCKRAGLGIYDLLCIYVTLIRSVLEYCCVVWHPALPKYLHEDVEYVQKRALKLIFPLCDYDSAMTKANLETLYTRRERQCDKLFRKMCHPSHKLFSILPLNPTNDYHLRRISIPHLMCQTVRYSNTFLPYCIRKFQ